MYTTQQQIDILNKCNTATELVNIRELLEETENLSNIAFAMFNIKLQNLFLINKI